MAINTDTPEVVEKLLKCNVDLTKVIANDEGFKGGLKASINALEYALKRRTVLRGFPKTNIIGNNKIIEILKRPVPTVSTSPTPVNATVSAPANASRSMPTLSVGVGGRRKSRKAKSRKTKSRKTKARKTRRV